MSFGAVGFHPSGSHGYQHHAPPGYQPQYGAPSGYAQPGSHLSVPASQNYAAPAPSPGRSLRFISASAMKQHPIKRNLGMIEADAVEESPTFLGVCDGVSEVQKMGIPPDELPREILYRCREIIESTGGHPQSLGTSDHHHWLINLIQESYESTQALGSTTVLVTCLEEPSQLAVANIGDCCLLLLRPISPHQPQALTIVYKTEATRYDANKPFQVARLDGVDDDHVRKVIWEARVDMVPVRHGDIIVMGSDGLFDNLHDEDCIRLVEHHCSCVRHQGSDFDGSQWESAPTIAQLESASDALVAAALESVSVGKVDETGNVQWPSNARNTPIGIGGKADDTTAVVAAIVEVENVSAHEEYFYEARSATRRCNPGGAGGWNAVSFMPRCCGVGVDDHPRGRRQNEPGCVVS